MRLRDEGIIKDCCKKRRCIPLSADHDLLAPSELELGSPESLAGLQTVKRGSCQVIQLYIPEARIGLVTRWVLRELVIANSLIYLSSH